jgi:hypothetical protein
MKKKKKKMCEIKRKRRKLNENASEKLLAVKELQKRR